MDIKKALTFDFKTNLVGLDNFVQQLPAHLRFAISHEIHHTYFNRFRLFKEIGHKNFLGWLGSRLKPRIFSEKLYVYQEGDIADMFYFQTKGVSAFVLKDCKKFFAVVDPEKYHIA